MNLNKVILLGELTKNPKLRESKKGYSVCTVNMNTIEKWTDQDGKEQSKLTWHRVILWGEMAQEYQFKLTQGDQVLVEGKLRTRSWVDEFGESQYMTEILASKIQYLEQ